MFLYDRIDILIYYKFYSYLFSMFLINIHKKVQYCFIAISLMFYICQPMRSTELLNKGTKSK